MANGACRKYPLKKASIGGALATLTTHHWSSLDVGFSELFRVLKRGSKLVIFTSPPAQMQTYWLNNYFPKALRLSMVQMPDFELTRASLMGDEA